MRLLSIALAAVAVALSVACAPAAPATITALSAGYTDVSNAVAQAVSGSTVLVPAGSVTWTRGLSITNRNIRLAGAGTNATLITDEIPRTTPETHLIKFITTSADSYLPQLSGFQFIGSNTRTQEMTNGRIRVMGDSKSARIDHCIFTNFYSVAVGFKGFIHGVIDHCQFDMHHTHPVIVDHDAWQPYNGATNMAGTPYTHGHGSWADLPYWGTDRFVFVESNIGLDRLLPNNSTAIDAFEGARLVVRFNQFTNILVTTHGTEGQGRSAKQVEEYNNSFTSSPDPESLPQIRGGAILTFSNVLANLVGGHGLLAYRMFEWKDNWAWAGGTNVYDDNVQHPVNGYWETGTHTGTMDHDGVDDSTKSWAVNQWLGTNLTFVVRNLTKYNALPADQQPHSYIIANTATAVVYSNRDNPPLRFDTGDVYQIWAVGHALDQPGQGMDNGLMNGLPATPAMWPTNATELCYSWAQGLGLEGLQSGITEGRDYTNNVAKPGYVPFTFPHPLVAGPQTPVLVYPPDLSPDVSPFGVTFQWTATNAFTYTVYLDTVDPPVATVATAWPQQSFTVMPLSPGTTYYWSVVASNHDGTATNSWSFSTSGSSPPSGAAGAGNGRRRLLGP